VVMTSLGVFNVLPSRDSDPDSWIQKFHDSGFRRGILLSILNPMAIPYWMGFTAYMKAQGWIDLSTPGRLHSYVLGTSLGALALLTSLTFFAHRQARYVRGNKWTRRLPGIILLILGSYAVFKYFNS
jgi:threonine/homoserine/homoserine lactone efflux protein